jgi:acetyltransferase-like isoleucine patch superfamily enzyme
MKKILKYIIFRIKYSNSQVAFSSVVSMDTSLSKGVKILPEAKIGSCKINSFTYIGYNCDIVNTEIGSFCSIGPEVLCGLGTHPSNFVSTYPGFYSNKATGSVWFGASHDFIEHKKTVIESDVWIGARAIIMGGITIGTGAIIAAGAIVTKNVPPYAIVGGVPANIIKYRFDELTIQKLLISKWWTKDELILRKFAREMDNPSNWLKNISIDTNN